MEAIALLAAQVSELAVLVAKQGERIAQLERMVDSHEAQMGGDDEFPAMDLAGRPTRVK